MAKDHFPVEEFRCKDGTPYPEEWVETRLPGLKRVLEVIRERCGGLPVTVLCGYRSPAYNERLRKRGLQGEGKTGVAEHSQHMEGNAADITIHGLSLSETLSEILAAWREGLLPELGGVGYYPNHGFIHVDTYRVGGRLRRWNG